MTQATPFADKSSMEQIPDAELGDTPHSPAAYGERLLLAMDRVGVDTSGLAKALGVSFQAVRQVLIGESKALTAANNVKAAQALQVSSDWLASGLGPMTPVVHRDAVLTDEEHALVRTLRALPESAQREVRDFIRMQADAAIAELRALDAPVRQHPVPRG